MRKPFHKQLISALFIAVFICPAITFAEKFYVATDGADTNNGSLAEPWLTIEHASSMLVAGDTVLVRAGTYNNSLCVQSSGNAVDGYITYMAYPGEFVVLDGTGVPEGNVPCVAGMDGFINVPGRSYVRIIGFHITDYTTHFGVLITGPDASHIEIRDCTVTNGNLTEWGGHAFIVHGEISQGRGNISDIIIDGCEVYGNDTHGNEQMTIYGDVHNFQVTNNIIHDGTNINFDIIGQHLYEGEEFGIPTNGLIKGNITYNSGDGDGIYVDGGGDPTLEDNIVIEDNISYSNSYCGITAGNEHEEAGEENGGILVRRNICYDNAYYGIHIGASLDEAVEVRNVKMYNNVTYHNNEGEFNIHKCTNVDIKNNIFFRRDDRRFNYMRDDSYNVTMDYNCWYPDGGEIQWEGTNFYNTVGAFQAASGQEAHGLIVDPQFVDADNYDFHLQAGSQCINKGVDVGAPYEGPAPDIGVYEFSTSSVDVSGVSLSLYTLTIDQNQTAALTVTVIPTSASNKNVTWSTSNSAVATVNHAGVVTGVGPGTAYIIVTTDDGGFSSQCQVNVEEVVTSVGIEDDSTFFSAYPNPAFDGRIFLESIDGTFNVVITDLKGKTVFKKNNISQQLVLSKNKLSPGMYLVRFSSSKNNCTSKLVVE